MNREQLNKILEHLHNYSDYTEFKEKVYSIINNHLKTHREDIYKLVDDILNFVAENNISRRKIYGVLHEIILEMQKSTKYSDQIYDSLTNFLDGMDGLTHIDCLNRFHNEPDDKKLILGFIYSLKWIDQEYYQG